MGDPASIRFRSRPTAKDRLQINGRIVPIAPIDPTQLAVAVRLSNANGLIYSTELPAGELTGRRRFTFRNRAARTDGGFWYLVLAPHRGGDRIDLVAYGDLSAATLPEMTVEISIGQGQYKHSATWVRTRSGWRDNGLIELYP